MSGRGYDKRYGSTMAELQAFYDAACLPGVDDALGYLEQFPYDDSMPAGEAAAVVVLRAGHGVVPGRGDGANPRVPDSGAASIDAIHEPAI